MNIGRRIDLQIATLTVLGGVLFGLGESHPILPLGLLLAAFLATRQAGDRQRFWLPTLALNGLIFVIAIASAWRFAYAYGTGEVVVLGDAFGGLTGHLISAEDVPQRQQPLRLELAEGRCQRLQLFGGSLRAGRPGPVAGLPVVPEVTQRD